MNSTLKCKDRLRILMLLPDEPESRGTGGAVRAWYFLKLLRSVGEVKAFVLATGNGGQLFDRDCDGSEIIRVTQGDVEEAERHSEPHWKRYLELFVTPWRKHGRALQLAGSNICVQRSEGGSLSAFHWCYGFWLVCLFALLRRITRTDTIDAHIRGVPLAVQIDRIRRIYRDMPPQIIWVEHSYLYCVAERIQGMFPRAQIVVNAHNVESRLKAGGVEFHPTWIGKCWLAQEAGLALAWEQTMLRKASLVLCCSWDDQQRYLRLLPAGSADAEVLIAPNGVDVRYFCRNGDTSRPQSKRLIFTGTAGYTPNDDAVRWLIAEVWPRIRERHPEAELLLAGRNAARCWMQFADERSGVHVRSDILDMRPLMMSAMAALVPIRSGSGTRLKILESLSIELPVVSTTIGAEGLCLERGKEILVADTVDDFVDATCRVLEDQSLRLALADAGRRRVLAEYDWDRILDDFRVSSQWQFVAGASQGSIA